MKHILSLMLLILLPLSVGAREVKLDESKRAQKDGWECFVPATRPEWREMQSKYHPEAFEMWASKLAQLRNGMTMKKVAQIIQPGKVETGGMTTPAGRVDRLALDDAYYAGVMVNPHNNRMVWVTHPIAITYNVQPATIRVRVSGKNHPGVYKLPGDTNLAALLKRAHLSTPEFASKATVFVHRNVRGHPTTLTFGPEYLQTEMSSRFPLNDGDLVETKF